MNRLTWLSVCLFSVFFAHSQVVINELDSDTPSTDDKEFVELKSTLPNQSLDGYVLIFFNGSTTSSTGLKSYFAIDLDGVSTNVNGIALIGNELVSPVPDKIFSANVIQNGADAVALYLGNASDFPDQTSATTANLVDALAYDTSDADAVELMALLGLTVQYDENANGLGATQSLQRTPSGSFVAATPTPGANNDGSGVQFNGVSMASSVSYEIAEGASFTITFTTQTPVATALNFSFSLVGTGINAADYSGNTSITIPAGSSSATTTIQIIDDTANEGDEPFRIRFGTLPSGYNRLNDNLSQIIIDNDYTVANYGTPLNPTFGIVTPAIPAGYYDSLEGKAGVELRQAIQEIIANPAAVHAQNYGDIVQMLQQADVNPLNSNQVWLMYVEQGRGKYKFQSTSSNVGSWNREHIFPQSRGGFSDGTSDQADGIDIWLPTGPDDILTGHGDGHHIRAEDGPENTSRSNRDYGSDYNGPSGNQGSWKGDVARALFYMAVRYNALHLVAGNPDDTSGNQVMGDLISLLAWNHSDPADDFEMHHNNVVYQWQANRNPFIDYPDLADYVFGPLSGQTWHSSLSAPSVETEKIGMYPNPAGDSIRFSGIANADIRVFNVSGLEVMKSEVIGNQPVALHLATGVYIVKVSSDGKSANLKLIVK